MRYCYKNFQDVMRDLSHILKTQGTKCKPKNWQAREVAIGMHEVFDVAFDYQVPPTLEQLVQEVSPDLPWADDHFAERVSREPMNPAPSYQWWPYYKQDDKWRPGGKFSHTYPERIWPTRAGQEGDRTEPINEGIRYQYGDLDDVINLLQKDPLTRQAFLPLWFPEDTGAHHGERVPCTIGYWFIHREDQIHIKYPMRSCDFRRHFKNDVYMAARLLMWVLYELRAKDSYWDSVTPGRLKMEIWNLHIFEGEENVL